MTTNFKHCAQCKYHLTCASRGCIIKSIDGETHMHDTNAPHPDDAFEKANHSDEIEERYSLNCTHCGHRIVDAVVPYCAPCWKALHDA